MTDADQQEARRLAEHLTKALAQLHDAWTVSMTDTVAWMHDARELEDHLARLSGTYAQSMARLIDHAEQRHFAFSLIAQVIVRNQAQLEDLLTLVGIDRGEHT